MLKEQQKQDKQLELIQRLEKELKSSKGKPALSVFVLPKDVKIEQLHDTTVLIAVSTGMKFGKPPYRIEFTMLDRHIPTTATEILTTYNDEAGRWERGQATQGIVCWLHQSHKGNIYDYRQGYTKRLLEELSTTIEPRVLLPSDTTHTSKAMALLKVVFGQKNSGGNGNWSKFLRLRGAWNDQDEAKDWVNKRHLLDFDWDVTLQEPARFGVDFGQSMEQEKVRKEQREAKYWWIDIPDLTGLVLKILPTLERQRKGTVEAEAVLWELKKDIDTARLPRNTSNNQLGERYGCSGHTVAKAVAMLTEEERRLIPYSKASKAVSVRATRQEDCIDNFTGGGSDQVSSRHKDRQEENKLTRLREEYVRLLVDEGFPSDQAWDMAMKYQTSATMQEELYNSTQNLK